MANIPSVLVTTDWVAQHATDAGIRVVEVDVDTTAYDQGHVPGAAGWNWNTQLCDTKVRDIVPVQKLEEIEEALRHPAAQSFTAGGGRCVTRRRMISSVSMCSDSA